MWGGGTQRPNILGRGGNTQYAHTNRGSAPQHCISYILLSTEIRTEEGFRQTLEDLQ